MANNIRTATEIHYQDHLRDGGDKGGGQGKGGLGGSSASACRAAAAATAAIGPSVPGSAVLRRGIAAGRGRRPSRLSLCRRVFPRVGHEFAYSTEAGGWCWKLRGCGEEARNQEREENVGGAFKGGGCHDTGLEVQDCP